MKPAIPITDKRFDYVPSHQTDIRVTFARVRAEQKTERSKRERRLVAVRTTTAGEETGR